MRSIQSPSVLGKQTALPGMPNLNLACVVLPRTSSEVSNSILEFWWVLFVFIKQTIKTLFNS